MESYILVVPAKESSLFEYLERRFKGDPAVSVVLDRRATRRPSPAAASRSVVLFQGVTVIRRGDATTDAPESVQTPCRAEEGGNRMSDGQEMLEDRQRVDRWLEESQYLLGRLIPGYLDDRDRLIEDHAMGRMVEVDAVTALVLGRKLQVAGRGVGEDIDET